MRPLALKMTTPVDSSDDDGSESNVTEVLVDDDNDGFNITIMFMILLLMLIILKMAVGI